MLHIFVKPVLKWYNVTIEILNNIIIKKRKRHNTFYANKSLLVKADRDLHSIVSLLEAYLNVEIRPAPRHVMYFGLAVGRCFALIEPIRISARDEFFNILYCTIVLAWLTNVSPDDGRSKYKHSDHNDTRPSAVECTVPPWRMWRAHALSVARKRKATWSPVGRTRPGPGDWVLCFCIMYDIVTIYSPRVPPT